MNNVYAILRHNADYRGPSARAKEWEALTTYAALLGTGEPVKIDQQTGRPLGWIEDGELLLVHALEHLEAGDTVVLRALRSISEDPHDALRVLRALVAKGARVHVLELGGSVGPHLDGMGAILSMVTETAAIIEEIQRQADERVAAEHEAATAAWRAKLHQLSEQGLFVPGNLQMEAPDSTDEPQVAAYLKARRRIAGYTQRDLAERFGVHQSTIARLEGTGRGELLAQVVGVVDSDFAWNGDDDEALRARAAEVLDQIEAERRAAMEAELDAAEAA